MINILVTSPCDEEYKKLLETAGGSSCNFTYADSRFVSEDILKNEIEKAEIIVGEPDVAAIKNAKNLKLLQLTMAGTDKYTKDYEYPQNVVLANASGAFGEVISQYVIGGILNICHKFYKYRDNQHKNLWHDEGLEIGLEGKRVLIVGAGDIGSNIAKKLSVFNTKTIGIRRNINNMPPYFAEMHTLDELDEQLPLADVVVACIPNSEYTYHLFDKHRFMLMKNDSIFVNVGRGALVIQKDLIDVLKSGHLSGAVIDVAEPEPLPPESELWSVENLVITPHISGKSFGHHKSITDKIYKICAENISNYINNKPLINVIDFKKFRK